MRAHPAWESCYFSDNEAFCSPKCPQILSNVQRPHSYFTAMLQGLYKWRECERTRRGGVGPLHHYDLPRVTLLEYRTNVSIHYLKTLHYHYVSPFHYALAVFPSHIQTLRDTMQRRAHRCRSVSTYTMFDDDMFAHCRSERNTQNGRKMERARHKDSEFSLITSGYSLSPCSVLCLKGSVVVTPGDNIQTSWTRRSTSCTQWRLRRERGPREKGEIRAKCHTIILQEKQAQSFHSNPAEFH